MLKDIHYGNKGQMSQTEKKLNDIEKHKSLQSDWKEFKNGDWLKNIPIYDKSLQSDWKEFKNGDWLKNIPIYQLDKWYGFGSDLDKSIDKYKRKLKLEKIKEISRTGG